MKQDLLEGGLAGHLMHLTDNLELTFDEFFEIISLASDNKLEKVVEKLDGQNVFFSYDFNTKTLRFARNKGDLTKGGMVRSDIETKWASADAVREAYTQAYDVLQAAVDSLSDQEKLDVFGDQTNVWFNAEIVSAANPNVINYDRNFIAPHEFGAIHIDRSGKEATGFDAVAAFEKLKNTFFKLQKTASNKGWDIVGPAIVNLAEGNTQIAQETISRIKSEIVEPHNLSTDNTLGDYVVKAFVELAGNSGISTKPATEIAKRMIEAPDKLQRVNQVVAMASSPEEAKLIGEADKNKEKYLKKIIRPIELIVNEFAIKLLGTLQSVLAKDPAGTVSKMQRTVEDAIRTLQQNPANSEFVNAQLQKLSGPLSSAEGVVFRYKGNSYKFTGNFAAVNQLLGAVRFGKVPGTTTVKEQTGETIVKTLAIYPGAFKPYQAGHDRMVRDMAGRVDKLLLQVSANDRKRPGEFPVIWAGGMEEVWKNYIIPTLPSNVEVQFVANPVTAAFEELGRQNDLPQAPLVSVVAGEEDQARFNQASLTKYAPNLVAANKIALVAPPRFGGFSGTKARAALLEKNQQEFAANLPESLKAHAKEIFDILQNAAVGVEAPPVKVKKQQNNNKMKISELFAIVEEKMREVLSTADLRGIAGALPPEEQRKFEKSKEKQTPFKLSGGSVTPVPSRATPDVPVGTRFKKEDLVKKLSATFKETIENSFKNKT
jgi:hypothetical protein